MQVTCLRLNLFIEKIKDFFKKLFFALEVKQLRDGNSRTIYVYEGKPDRGYEDWITKIARADDAIFELIGIPRFRLFLGKKKSRLPQTLTDAKIIVFHSPGEHLQYRLISKLRGIKPLLIGVQHGFLPQKLPRRARFVLSRADVDIYFVVQPHLIGLIRNSCESGSGMISDQFGEAIKGTRSILRIYFDAPDNREFLTQAIKVRDYCYFSKSQILELKFHPATGLAWRLCVTIFLNRYRFTSKSLANNDLVKNVSWHSKVRQTFPETNRYTIDDQANLRKANGVSQDIGQAISLSIASWEKKVRNISERNLSS